MEEYSRNQFEQMKNDAARRVMEMYKGTGGKMPPYPDFITLPSPQKNKEIQAENEKKDENNVVVPRQRNSGFINYLNFGELMKNKDGLLLIGLILLLAADGADDLLILALAYVLL